MFPPLDWGSEVGAVLFFLSSTLAYEWGQLIVVKSQAVEGPPYIKRLMTWDQTAIRRTKLERVTSFLFLIFSVGTLCYLTHVEVKGLLGSVYSSTLWVLRIEFKLLVLATNALNPLSHIIKPGISGIQGKEGL